MKLFDYQRRDDEEGPRRVDAQIPNTLDLGWHYSENKDEIQMAKIPERDRATHTYVIGGTGTGKTKFLEFLIAQDIQRENGFAVIDPHGDLVEDVKGFLACRYHAHGERRELSQRTILVDPTDPRYTAIFNPLERLPNTSPAEQATELVACFRRIWSDAWGVRMEDLLRNSLIALGEAGATLPELPAFLTKEPHRRRLLKKVRNPTTLAYFERFNALTERTQATWAQPVMNKINAFLADDRVRQMLSAPKSTFDLRETMDRGMILLIKLDKGRLKGAGDLLGSLLMAKIQMAAFSRSDIPPNRRRPFYLYVDEFQNFATDSFHVVLSEARKYGLSLIMAHQTLAQISGELRSLILGNAGLQVYFRLNRQDAQRLAKEIFEYSGYEVKFFRRHTPSYWSLGEEWERKTEELQRLPPRLCFAKHKIQGGLLLLRTADVDPPWQILDMEEDAYHEYVSELPFGRAHLVPKAELPAFARPEEKRASSSQRKESDVEPGMGKGGRRHRYLQGVIKRMAEESGYRATIEKPTPDGRGQVDVGLEGKGKRIACEISVTTGAQQELANVRKCLEAGYDRVVLCALEEQKITSLRETIEPQLEEKARKRVRFLQPEDLLLYLERHPVETSTTERRVKGYRVKVQRQAESQEEEETKRQAIASVLLRSLRRLHREE